MGTVTDDPSYLWRTVFPSSAFRDIEAERGVLAMKPFQFPEGRSQTPLTG
jgi:hypothetical protein